MSPPAGFPLPKRRLPRTSDHRSPHTLPGIGRAVVQSVGSCNHTTGADVFLHRCGHEEAAVGCLRFRALIDPDAGVIWRVTRNGRVHGWRGEFSVEERAAMHRLVADMPTWSPTGYLFHVLGAVEIAQAHHERRLGDWMQTIKTLTQLLADPRGPIPVTMEGPMSPAQRVERIAQWRTDRARAEQAIVDHFVEYADTLHMLRRARAAIAYACTVSVGRGGRDDVGGTIAEALHPTRPVERRGLIARWGRLVHWNPAGWPWAEPGPAWD